MPPNFKHKECLHLHTLLTSLESAHRGDMSCFLVRFEPLLENVLQHIKQKKELHEKADEQNRLRLQELNQSTLMTEETFSLEVAARKEEAGLVDLEANIPL